MIDLVGFLLSLVIEDDIMDFEEIQLRSDAHNGVLIARTATKVADELLHQYRNNDLNYIILIYFF